MSYLINVYVLLHVSYRPHSPEYLAVVKAEVKMEYRLHSSQVLKYTQSVTINSHYVIMYILYYIILYCICWYRDSCEVY